MTAKQPTTIKMISKTKALTWTAREPSSGRRWWAFLLVAYFTPPLAILLIAFGNWSAGLAVAVFGVTFFVVYLPRPKIWSYRLSGTTLKVTREHRRGPADEKVIDLQHYHSIDVRHLKSRRRGRPTTFLTLWPNRRLASDVDVYLPATEATAQQVSKTIARAVLWLEKP